MKTVTNIGQLTRFYEQHPAAIGKVKVNTRFGYKTILAAAVTARNSQYIKVTTADGTTILGSPDHLMLSNNIEWKKIKHLCVGDLLFNKDGPIEITKIKHYKAKKDLYDLQVEEVKEFYANGLVSHNSTMIEALTFAVFGKPFRDINKPQLVNSITGKKLLVELEFTIGKKEYMIRRGMKPTVFEIYVDGEMLNQTAIGDQQDHLEKNILKLNFKSFTQIVVLGSANYVPFMQLKSQERRKVVEDLLDIQIFSIMNSLLKDKMSTNRSDLQDVEYQINLCEQKIEMHSKHIDSLKANNDELIEQKKNRIAEYDDEIASITVKTDELLEQVQSLNDQVSDYEVVNKKKNKLVQMEAALEDKIKKIKREIQFFHDHDNCPTCKQGIDHYFKNEKISDREAKTTEVTDALKKIEVEISNASDRLQAIQVLNTQIHKLNMDIQSNNQSIEFHKKYIADLENEIKTLEDQSDKIDSGKTGETQTFKKELALLEKRKEELSNDRAVFDIAAHLLKDSGIKTKIIRQYVPIMNKLINKYLAAMDFFVNFELDEAFSETIKSRFRDDFSYASFSEGEKLRIDLALMFTWRAIAKLRNSASTNLLIMDEVFDSSLDSAGTEEFLKILESLTQDTNTFIISHKGDQLADKFHSTIRFEKHANFSRLAA